MKVRERLTYANVMSTIAAFAALATGGAYAVDRIGTKDLKPNAVTAPKIKRGAVRTEHIKGRAVTGNKLAKDSVYGAKIRDQSVARQDIRLNAIGCGQLEHAIRTTIRACNSQAP